ncbi:hypothetical protein [Clostridium sp.]|uniref:hypothetical protein n=1 Tax=Clostridium sp. TaxID=1506 RepID=UPI002603281F|nr:hypothetical protein [Clostridium sp.]
MSIIKQTRFTEKQLEAINRYAEVKGYKFSEAVRTLCQKGLEIEVANDNINLVVEIIDERLRAILKPQVERLASISAKGAIMSATSTFLNAQALSDFVPPQMRKDLVDTYEKARLKGVAYVKGRNGDCVNEVIKGS